MTKRRQENIEILQLVQRLRADVEKGWPSYIVAQWDDINGPTVAVVGEVMAIDDKPDCECHLTVARFKSWEGKHFAPDWVEVPVANVSYLAQIDGPALTEGEIASML